MTTVTEWISVKYRMPDSIESVLVYVPGNYPGRGTVTVSWFNRDKGFNRWMHSGFSKKFMKGVTHWMPLPEPPKEGE